MFSILLIGFEHPSNSFLIVFQHAPSKTTTREHKHRSKRQPGTQADQNGNQGTQALTKTVTKNPSTTNSATKAKRQPGNTSADQTGILGTQGRQKRQQTNTSTDQCSKHGSQAPFKTAIREHKH